MSHVIGRGRYARVTYPQSPGAAGGGSASIVPLARQRFIDGDTAQVGLNGSIADPFKTIAQFMASRGNASVQDASSAYVGWLMPALNGYTEDVSFPPYAATELRGECLSLENGAGTAITGNVTWANVAGAFAGEDPAVVMHNISVTGTFTVTDDVGAPGGSSVLFGADELTRGSVFLIGGFVSSAATNFGSATFCNAIVAQIDCGTALTSAGVLIVGSQVGPVTARAVTSFDSVHAGNVVVNETATFTNCTFSQGTSPEVTAPNGAFFDGPSWQSFEEAGGDRDVGTFALVVGGYNGGAVPGADLTAANSPMNVTLNGTGASAPYQGSNSGNFFSAPGLLGGVVVTLQLGGGELEGDTILISKPDTAAQGVTVNNSVGAGIGTIPTGERGFVLARFDGTDWVMIEGGSLAA